ncbi:hypothetical protein VIGAN_08115200 [Vigna angularis var. angularis]|uniref:Uncharacterized protein n=1 Tax=Vigna angularis var. angularis TaxID=157739 RepID=A0A0S3SNW4_PHAAN|nr:hypothetical protein VIGAN_08115200 [Vigna angularis var. angularis]
MNGECGNAQNGSIDFDKLMHKRIISISENDPPSNTQIPIKPSVPQPSSISLNVHHRIVTLARSRFGLQFQAGAVRVRRNHVKSIAHIVPSQNDAVKENHKEGLQSAEKAKKEANSLFSDGESDQTGHVAREEVASSGLDVPVLILVEHVETGGE